MQEGLTFWDSILHCHHVGLAELLKWHKTILARVKDYLNWFGIFAVRWKNILCLSAFKDERKAIKRAFPLHTLCVYPACGNSCSSGWIWSRHIWRCSRPTLSASLFYGIHIAHSLSWLLESCLKTNQLTHFFKVVHRNKCLCPQCKILDCLFLHNYHWIVHIIAALSIFLTTHLPWTDSSITLNFLKTHPNYLLFYF